MTTSLLCCERFKKLVAEDEIERQGTPDGFCFVIHGSPSFADEGDGCYDDTTGEYVIDFCLFCGKRLDNTLPVNSSQ